MALGDELARARAQLPPNIMVDPDRPLVLSAEAEESVLGRAAMLLRWHESDLDKLDTVRRYWKGLQRMPAIVPASALREVREMAKVSRVNLCEIVVDSLAQSLFVDGFRLPRQAENLAVWDVWQANRFDREQSGVHRAAIAYGTSYVLVMPGDPQPKLRGISPRRITALYGDDPDWPVYALERLGTKIYRFYDEQAVYLIERGSSYGSEELEISGYDEHGMGFVPIVRFRDAVDLDAEDDVDEVSDRLVQGQVSPLIPLQDQVDITTFGLMVAQHFGAFRQRWILGWVAETEAEQMKASAAHIMAFEDHPDDIKLGEFSQTQLDGYIKSREEIARFAATLSQTPVHELIGQMINLSAEALAAAEAGRDRKVNERQTGFGESWEQVFQLVGGLIDEEIPDDSEVVWRDTNARSFAATVDGLGKLAQMLGIPPQALWERVPGATQQDVERWKALAEEGDTFSLFSELLQRQAAPLDEEQPATNGQQPAEEVPA